MVISRRTVKKLLVLTFAIMIAVIVKKAFFEPTTLNAYIAEKIYKTPANASFNDENFYKCVVDAYNTKNYSSLPYTTNLTDEQLNTITYLECNNKNVTDASGLEKITSLTNITLNNNKLTSLNTSNNLKLARLQANYNLLENLNVSGNTNLIELRVRSNKLTGIDLATNIALKELEIQSNPIISLNVDNNVLLTSLNISRTKFSTLNLSYNTKLEELSAESSALTELDLTSNVELSSINLDTCKLTSLDLSKNKKLKRVQTKVNKLTSLNVNGLVELEHLDADSNELTSIDISSNQALKTLLLGGNALTSINMDNNVLLTKLNVSDNKLTTLDVSKNTLLEELYLYDNSLTNINLANNIALLKLSVHSNKLTSLDLSNNTELNILTAYNNKLTNLNVSNNKKITYLSVYTNQLTNLDLSQNSLLKTLSAYSNELVSVNLNGADALETIDLNSNKLSSIDLSHNPSLLTLRLDSNSLKNINLNNNTLLKTLNVSYNGITSLDLSKNTQLTTVESYVISSAQGALTSLDVTKNTLLNKLNLSGNKLTSIDLSHNTLLTELNLTDNSISTLDLTKNTELKTLDLMYNQLNDLDLTKNTKLTKVNLMNNKLSSIDISKNLALVELNIVQNKLESIDVSKNLSLKTLNLTGNRLTNIDVANNTNLEKLEVSNNKLSNLDASNNLKLNYLRLGSNSFEVSDDIYIYSEYKLTGDFVKLPSGKSAELQGISATSNYIINSNERTVIPTKSGSTKVYEEYKHNVSTYENYYSYIYNLNVFEITSKKYIIDNENDYIIILGDNDVNTIKDNITVPEGISLNVDLTNNKITVLKDSKVLNEFTLVKATSTLYDLSKDYIFVGTGDFDINDVTVTNGEKEFINNKLLIKKDNTIIKSYDIVKISSNTYDLNKDYIYLGTGDLDISKITVTNADKEEKDNKLQIKYDSTVLKSYSLSKIRINNYNVNNNIIAIFGEEPTYDVFASNIETTYLSYKLFKDTVQITSGKIQTGMKLKIYKNTDFLDEYTIITEYKNFDESLNVNEKEKCINKISEGTKVSDLLLKIDTNATVKMKNNKGTLLTNTDFVGTGSKIIMEFSNRTEEYTIIVEGDVTGDGVINIADVIKLADHTVTRDILTDIEQKAGESTGDSTLNIADVIKLADYTVDKNIVLWR